MTITDPRLQILRAAVVDWVSLAEAVSYVRSARPQSSPATLRALTLDLVSDLVRDGLVQVGDLRPRFAAWEGTRDHVVEALREAWPEAMTEPDVGDVCWLDVTPEGERIGRGNPRT